jgi:outer membrane protein
VRDAEKLISVATKGLEQAQEAYKQAQARYRAQVGTNFDVLDASANLTAAETTLIGAKAGYLTALSALYAAMGELKPDLGLAGK